jgi:hypothetical protein
MGQAGLTNDRKWLAGVTAALLVAAVAPVALLAITGGLSTADDKRFAAVVGFIGVALTVCSSVIATAASRQSARRLAQEHDAEEARLRLDAAMKAAALLSRDTDTRPAEPAAVASGLLALTELGRADLAVALLVDLWDSPGPAEGERPSWTRRTVSDETAILVIDAALSSSRASAQLVAAEMLCRNAWRLDLCQSLHWPSCIDGRWDPLFGVKTKFLIVDALTRMAYTTTPSLNAIQSMTVRLHGVSVGDPDVHVKGCVGMLLNALVPSLKRLNVKSLMQGPAEITIGDVESAALHAKPNPDRAFYEVVRNRSEELSRWGARCEAIDHRPGALAATAL